jgi:hypothetical protein
MSPACRQPTRRKFFKLPDIVRLTVGAGGGADLNGLDSRQSNASTRTSRARARPDVKGKNEAREGGLGPAAKTPAV